VLGALVFLVPLSFGVVVGRRFDGGSPRPSSEPPSATSPFLDSTGPFALDVPLAEPAPPSTASAGRSRLEAPPGPVGTLAAAAAREPDVARLGIVVRDRLTGRGLAGARVEVGLAPEGAPSLPPRLLEADARGRASLEAAPGGARLVAWGEGCAGGPLEVELVAGDARTVVLECSPTFAVAGRVVEADSGLPVAGAEVSFWTFAESDRVVTAVDGSFVHPRFPASDQGLRQQVHVRADGHGSAVRYLQVGSGGWSFLAALSGEEAHGGSGEPWIEIGLPRELRVRGSVHDARGRPIEGACVSAEGFFRTLPNVASLDGGTTASLADGSFELAGLRADIGHSLLVEAPGCAARVLEIPAGESVVALGALELERECLLSGTVLDLEGFPVEDLSIELEPLEPAPEPAIEGSEPIDVAVRVESTELAARTGAEGVFVFEHLLERPYRLTAARDGAALVEREIHPLPDGGFGHLELELERGSRTLAGSVHLRAGTRAESIELSRNGRVGRFTLATDGSFRASGLDDAAPYLYRVRALDPRTGERFEAEGEVWVGDRLRVDLEAAAPAPELAGLAALDEG
jgi:hypothetical protein